MVMNVFFPALIPASVQAYLLEQSLLFDGASYLSRTPSTAGNRKTFTFSVWHKRGAISSYPLYSAYVDTNNRTSIQFGGLHNLQFVHRVASTNIIQVETSAVFRDPTAWYHIVVAVDTTLATSTDRVKIWVNGTLVSDTHTTAAPLNTDTYINSVNAHNIGAIFAIPQYQNGLAANNELVDGAALDPTSFGELDNDGYWNPIEYTGSYGTNGGAYDFADSSHFGNDVSGAGVTPDLTVATSWSGTNLAQYGFSAGNITKNTLSQNAIRTAGVWGGDFSITLDLQDGDGTFGTNEEFFGFASASDTFDDTKTASTITGTNYYIQPATDSATLMTYYRNGAALSTFAVVPGDTIKWERSGTTVTLYVNTVSRFSETTSLTGLVYGFIQLYKTNESADNVTTTGTFSNSFIDNGFVSTDQLADTPTDSADDEIGNFATWNPNDGDPEGQFTPSEGNTVATFVTGSCEVFGSIAVTSGKYWFEITLLAKNASSNTYCGIQNTDESNLVYYRMDGAAFDGTTFSGAATYATFTTGDRIGIALDLDAGTPTCAFYKNGSLIFTASAFSGAQVWRPFCYCDLSSTSWKLDAGQFGFVDTPPTGFKALATQNLPAPTIADGSDYFNTVLYTGTGSELAITSLDFTPDFVWIKNRDATDNHMLYDSVRGATKDLHSNTIDVETTTAQTLKSFDSAGFTLGTDVQVNTNTEDYVAWCWKANGAGSSNTDGSITATVSANQTAGFSIVTYTGTGVAATVGHGLGVPNDFMIFKSRSNASSPGVVTSALGFTKDLLLETTDAAYTRAAISNNTAPTSAVFSVGTDTAINASGYTYVAYCWAEVKGFSKFGSYTGNGSTGGPFVYTGFRPAFVIIKKSSAAGTSWNMFDNKRNPFNLVSQSLWANASDAEYTFTNSVNFTSNGFYISGNPSQLNASAATHIYAAFAEHPFQGAEGYTQARAR